MTAPDDRIRNCLADPGPLSGMEAIHAFCFHFACTGTCLPRSRATDALNAEYVAEPDAASVADNPIR